MIKNLKYMTGTDSEFGDLSLRRFYKVLACARQTVAFERVGAYTFLINLIDTIHLINFNSMHFWLTN